MCANTLESLAIKIDIAIDDENYDEVDGLCKKVFGDLPPAPSFEPDPTNLEPSDDTIKNFVNHIKSPPLPWGQDRWRDIIWMKYCRSLVMRDYRDFSMRVLHRSMPDLPLLPAPPSSDDDDDERRARCAFLLELSAWPKGFGAISFAELAEDFAKREIADGKSKLMYELLAKLNRAIAYRHEKDVEWQLAKRLHSEIIRDFPPDSPRDWERLIYVPAVFSLAQTQQKAQLAFHALHTLSEAHLNNLSDHKTIRHLLLLSEIYLDLHQLPRMRSELSKIWERNLYDLSGTFDENEPINSFDSVLSSRRLPRALQIGVATMLMEYYRWRFEPLADKLADKDDKKKFAKGQRLYDLFCQLCDHLCDDNDARGVHRLDSLVAELHKAEISYYMSTLALLTSIIKSAQKLSRQMHNYLSLQDSQRRRFRRFIVEDLRQRVFELYAKYDLRLFKALEKAKEPQRFPQYHKVLLDWKDALKAFRKLYQDALADGNERKARRIKEREERNLVYIKGRELEFLQNYERLLKLPQNRRPDFEIVEAGQLRELAQHSPTAGGLCPCFPKDNHRIEALKHLVSCSDYEDALKDLHLKRDNELLAKIRERGCGPCIDMLKRHAADNIDERNYLEKRQYEALMNGASEAFMKQLKGKSRHKPRGKGKANSEEEHLYFFGLQRWNSFTPALARSQGGGYLLYRTDRFGRVNLGIAIDPGFDFVENLFRMGFTLSDLDVVLISHAHPDHLRDFESIISLLFELKKREKIHRRVHLITTEGVYDRLKWIIMNPYLREFLADTYLVTWDRADQEDGFTFALKEKELYCLEEIELGQGWDVRIVPTKAYHHDGTEFDSCGFKITTRLKDNCGQEVTFGYTGDTKWHGNDLIDKYDDCEAVCIHLGGMIDRGRKFEYYDTFARCMELVAEKGHPYLYGLLKYINRIADNQTDKQTTGDHNAVKTILVSEFGEELKGNIRIDFVRRLNNIYKKQLVCLPVDIGLNVQLDSSKEKESSKVYCAGCETFVPGERIEYKTYGHDEAMFYFCDTCVKSKPHDILQGIMRKIVEEGYPLYKDDECSLLKL